jgi:hypothetical protein
MPDDTSMIGHNSGDDADIYAPYRQRTSDIVEAANTWLKSIKEITDLETARACDDFLNQIRDELAAMDKDRKSINKPHDDAITANNNAFRPFIALLDKSKALLTPLKTKWLQREKDRLAAERAAKEAAALKAMQEAEDAKRKAAQSVEAAVHADEAQKAMEEALAASAAADKAKASVKGDYAARASGLRTYWSAEIMDYAKALQHYGNHPEVKDLIQNLANRDARADKAAMDVPGCKPKSEERA